MSGLDRATPRPWSWWTSCSWRRLSSDVRGFDQDGGVLCPVIAPDGHPDLRVSQADMQLIDCAVNNFDALVETLRDFLAAAGNPSPELLKRAAAVLAAAEGGDNG